VALNFCGILILRMGDSLCFAGTKLRLGEAGFSCWELIFTIFKKSTFICIYGILDF